jgi:hypothetical protein
MSTDFRAELQRLVEAYDKHGGKWPDHHEQALFQAVENARTALSQQHVSQPYKLPKPVAPTDEELDELLTEIDHSGKALSWRAYARAALVRWGTPANSLPIPPGP